MDYPNISILTPTYNRSKFLPLFISNLKSQTYPHKKLEVVIYDDGTESFTDSIAGLQIDIYPMKLVYHRTKVKKTIGEKRNELVKLSSSKILINMDDDDIYNPQYIQYSYHVLKDEKKSLVGSNGMLFTYPLKDFNMTGIQCKELFQIHEATMCYTKKHFKSMGGYHKNSKGEGVGMVQNQKHNIGLTDIRSVMICVAHDGNSVDKSMFYSDELRFQHNYDGKEVPILKQILGLE
jgi:glycosyltransferase involved in cell wall biosynthesis